jgi:HEAT repeat protein
LRNQMQQQMPTDQLQQMQQQAQAERLTALQLQELQRQYWERLFLKTVEMSEPELRATLKHRSSDRRFAAAYVVGERLLGWPEDLIPLLEDGSEAVRQAARRSLIILSFLVLNPEEAQRIRAPQRGGTVTPLSQLKSPVDFGPQPGAKREARARAAKQWKEWWADQRPSLSTFASRSAADDGEGGRLADALAQAPAGRRPDLVTKYRDSKGAQYTEALAFAIARESGEARRQLREALAERMTRMTKKTLGQYLEDEDAEVRRAAALGLAMRESKAHVEGLIGLLLDPQPSVERAAHAALRSLSGEDFGPAVNATEEDKTEAVARWRRWWAKR